MGAAEKTKCSVTAELKFNSVPLYMQLNRSTLRVPMSVDRTPKRRHGYREQKGHEGSLEFGLLYFFSSSSSSSLFPQPAPASCEGTWLCTAEASHSRVAVGQQGKTKRERCGGQSEARAWERVSLRVAVLRTTPRKRRETERVCVSVCLVAEQVFGREGR